jgi:hypothetical protein
MDFITDVDILSGLDQHIILLTHDRKGNVVFGRNSLGRKTQTG